MQSRTILVHSAAAVAALAMATIGTPASAGGVPIVNFDVKCQHFTATADPLSLDSPITAAFTVSAAAGESKNGECEISDLVGPGCHRS